MSKRVLKNILKNGNEYEVGNIKLYVITENIVSVSTDDTKGVSPYNTSYGYTNITIDENSGIKWKEGAVYAFVINTEMVVAGDYRNIRVRIGTNGTYIPVMNASNTIMAGSSYFTKARNDLYVYKTTHQSGGALHMNNDTSYSAMGVSEGQTGTATSARTVRADYLKQIIEYHAGNLDSQLSIPSKTSDLENDSYREGSDIFIEGGKLPSGYTQLEYAQSDGTFGINTGRLYDGTSDLKIEARFMGTAYNGGGACPFGLQDSGYVKWLYPFYGESTTIFTYWGNLARRQQGYYHLNKIYTIRFNTEGSTFWREINGVDEGVATYDKTAVSTISPLFIFSGGMGEATQNGFAGKIYSLRIWKGTTLDLNLIPAKRNSDNAIGMYDIVHDSFFTHSSLVAGPVVDRPFSLTAMNMIVDDGASTVSQNAVSNKAITTYVNTSVSGKQDALATQTAYTTKGTATKVPTITTNTLGQVTAITETSITFPVTSVGGSTGAVGLKTINGNSIVGSGNITAGGISNDTTGTTSTLTNIWVGTEAQYTALSNKSTTTLYFTF